MRATHGDEYAAIRIYNVPWWMWRTLVADRARYHSNARPLSARRLRQSIFPSLRRPVFAIGAPRSGTTFLGECLAALPGLSYHFEPIATKIAVHQVHVGAWSFAKAKFFYRMVYRWLIRIHVDGDLRFAEKTPRNVWIVSMLKRAFPDAQFVHIVRDGRDVALSLLRQPWLRAVHEGAGVRDGEGALQGPHARFWVERERAEEFQKASDIRRCAWTWRRFTEAGLALADELPSSQYHQLRYEDLVTESKQEADRLLRFLEFDDPVSRQRLHEAVMRAKTTSIGGWRRGLSPTQVEEIVDEAGVLLRSLGYLS